jgi:hypothetical protein
MEAPSTAGASVSAAGQGMPPAAYVQHALVTAVSSPPSLSHHHPSPSASWPETTQGASHKHTSSMKRKKGMKGMKGKRPHEHNNRTPRTWSRSSIHYV